MIRRWLAILFLVVLPLSALAATPAQTTDITYQRYDVEITLRPDGNFHVREIQQIRFGGTYHTAFAEIPTAYTQSINNVRVSENGQEYRFNQLGPGTYKTTLESGRIYVDWEYTETRSGDTRNFVVEYDVYGGLWVYPDEKILEWRAITEERNGIPVQNSRVTVILPQEVPSDSLKTTAYGPPYTVQTLPDRVVFEAVDAIPDGTFFQVQVGFPPDLVSAELQRWQEEEDRAQLQYEIEAHEVELTLQANGALNVLEAQRLAVTRGQLDEGYRSISHLFLDDIRDVRLWEGNQAFTQQSSRCDYCFQLIREPRQPSWVYYDQEDQTVVIQPEAAGQTQLTWTVPPLVRGESTTFVLQYRALGTIQVFSDHQELRWTAVYTEHALPIDAATVTLTLPPEIRLEDIEITGGTPKRLPDGRLQLVHAEPLPANRGWVIGLTLPAKATGAMPAAWQREIAQTREEGRNQAIYQARATLGLSVLGILILVGGLALILLIWYLWGRDPAVQLPGEFLKTPPSDLPPGIVAYLLDEKPTVKGALASIFHMGTLGLVRITLNPEIKIQRNSDEPVHKILALQTPEGESLPIPPHMALLYQALSDRVPSKSEVPFQVIAPDFHQALPQIYEAMGKEAKNFFDMLPDTSRRLWVGIGIAIFFGGVITFCIFSSMASWAGFSALLPGMALGIVGLTLAGISHWMPRRTTKGALETARWRAFKRHLENLKQYGDLQQAQEILDRYFAYAVAMDVERAVLKQAEELGAAMPLWTLPADLSRHDNTWILRRPQRSAGSTRLPDGGLAGTPIPGSLDPSAPKLDLPPVETPSLQGLSDRLARSIDEASSGLAQLLNTAAQSPTHTASSGSDTLDVLGDILGGFSSGGGGGGYRSSSSSSRSSWSSSSSRSSSSRSSHSSRSSFSGRSSSSSSGSRRSGGGGGRGFR